MNEQDELMIQRCLDDELSVQDTRLLMARLNQVSDGWKTLACGFLQERSISRGVLGQFPLELTVKPRMMEQPAEFVVSVELSGSEPSGDLPPLKEYLQQELKQQGAQLRLRQIPPGIMIERSLPQEEIQRLVDQAIKAAQDSSRKQPTKIATVPESPSAEADTQSEIKALKDQLSAVLERLNQLEHQK